MEDMVRNPDIQLSALEITGELREQAGRAHATAATDTVALTATFTAESLAEPLRHWMKELELPATVEFAPYGQVFQQLLDPNSLLRRNQRGLNVVLVRLEDWQHQQAAGRNGGVAASEIEQSVSELVLALKSAAANGPVPYLVCICPPADNTARQSKAKSSHQPLESRLASELRDATGIYLVTTVELFDLYPVADYYDPRSDELGHVPYTPALFTALATMIARKYHALKRPPCKVIALDCDQTLWAGICGEDGPGGVELDPPRRALQQFMRQQLDLGRLLCLCSKNNEDDVAAVFDRIREMPLQPEHFAVRRINWNPKSANLRALADELGVGLESVVLVDDSPMECAEVSANCPEAVALQLPDEPQLIPQFLKHCWIFDSLQTTSEDTRRTALYQQNRRREELRRESLSFADFLGALKLSIQIAGISPTDLPRVAQLTQRTNQFNTTTRRRMEGELQPTLRKEGWEIRTVRVSDRFGDYGLVGVMSYRVEKAALNVDSFLLSCRVLGKGVEHRMLSELGRIARERGVAQVNIHFNPSAKNKPAHDFLESVAGPFRQALNGGFVYSIPVETAETISFRPPETKGTAAMQTGGPGSPSLPQREAKKFDRWRWIALEANGADKILKWIGTRTVARTRASSGREPRTELERQLCEIWKDLLRVDRVGIDEDFFEVGGHSFLAVRLFVQIEKLTGKRLPLVAIFQSPTIQQLAQRIARTACAQAAPSLIVPIQPHGARAPLFLVHGAGGDAIWGYANLAKHLGQDQPVYGIQARATDAPDKFATLEEMAADYIVELRAFQPNGPYCLGGYCFGGSLAYEMARQLKSQGQEVAFVALLESTPEGGTYERVFWWRPGFPFRFLRNLYYCVCDFLGYTPEERRSLVRRKLKVLARRIRRRILRDEPESVIDLDDIIDSTKFQAHEIELWDAHLRLLVKHTSKPYSGHVTVFRTAAHPLFSSYEDDLGWGHLTECGVTVKVNAGSHGNIFLEPQVRHLARNVASALERVPTQPDPAGGQRV
jgi:FkbH-like protein